MWRVSLYLENIYLSIESLMEVILKWFRNVHNWGILVMSIRSSVNYFCFYVNSRLFQIYTYIYAENYRTFK